MNNKRKHNTSKYTELGGYVLSPKLAIIVSQDKHGKFYIGQRQTFYDGGKAVNVFKRRATLSVTADDLKRLSALFSDIAELYK